VDSFHVRLECAVVIAALLLDIDNRHHDQEQVQEYVDDRSLKSLCVPVEFVQQERKVHHE